MPRVTIALLSNYPQLPESIIKQVKSDLSAFKPTSKLEDNHTVITVNGYELEFTLIKNTEVGGLKNLKPQLFLYLFPSRTPENERYYKHDAATDLKESFAGQIPVPTQAHLVFLGDGQSQEEQAIQKNLAGVFPNSSCLAGKTIGQHIMHCATNVAPLSPAKPRDRISDRALELSSSELDNVSSPNFISRVLGALLRAVFGAVISLVVYNPISSVFAALSRLQRNVSLESKNKWVNITASLIVILLSPIWGPLKGFLYDGIYRQMRRGWYWGFSSGLNPFYQIAHEADLSNFVGSFYDARKLKQREKSAVATPISRRNIIAGIIIVSLIVAAGLAVWLPVVNVALGISAYAALYGLGSLSLTQLALAAAGAALVAGTFLYGLGVALNNVRHWLMKNFSKGSSPQAEADERREASVNKIGLVSRIFGAIFGAVYGAATALVVFNPLTAFFYGMRKFWQGTIKGYLPPENRTLLDRFLFNPLKSITAFLWLPLLEILGHGLLGQGFYGFQCGFATILGFGKGKSARDCIVDESKTVETYVKRRDIIAGLVITGLAVAAGLAFVIAPVSIFLGIPALLTTYGLAGMATWGLALIAAAVTLAGFSVLYGMGSNFCDVYDKWQSSQADETRPAPDSSITSSSAAATRRMRGRDFAAKSHLEVEPEEHRCGNHGGFFSSLTSCLAGICSGSSKISSQHTDESDPLITFDAGAAENSY